MLVAFEWVLSICPGAWAEAGSQAGEANVRFRWAFGALTGAGKDRRLVAVTRDTTLKTGDELKMLVDLQSACFVYVIYYSAQGEVNLLFPGEVRQTAPASRTPVTYHIPEGEAWFRLDEHVGRETFYLLASARRLNDLETLLTAYQSADASKKSELADRVVAHVREVRRQHQRLATAAERPASIAGNVRGVTPDLGQVAVEISAMDFYGKTFTIDHR
jgi:hypothetical protein